MSNDSPTKSRLQPATGRLELLFMLHSSVARWILLFLAFTAIIIRFTPPLMNFMTSDMYHYLMPWVQLINLGGWRTYSFAFTDYTPLYTYLLAIPAMLPASCWTAAIKTISILADIFLAVSAGYVVWTATFRLTDNARQLIGMTASVLVLWMPTVWLNSALWGQCDAMWSGCCILSLAFFLKDRPTTGMICYGFAFALKLQAMFFSPVILVLILARRVKWRQTLWVPAVYLATCLPCVMAGRDWESLLNVYTWQAGESVKWFCGAPSFYFPLKGLRIPDSTKLLIMAILAVTTVFLCIATARRYRAQDTAGRMRLLLVFTAFCGGAYPYLLPSMHERYFYLCDIACLSAACVMWDNRRLWMAAAAVEAASGSMYFSYLFMGLKSSLLNGCAAVLAFGALVILSRQIITTDCRDR